MSVMEFKCKICIKQYKSYQSLWNHNHKFHSNITIQKPTITNQIPSIKQPEIQPVITGCKYICKFCNKSFNHYNNKWRHQKTCKHKNNIVEENKLLKQSLDEIKKQLLTIMNDKCKIHPKTLNKINKQINNSNTNSNNTNNTNNTNNGTINNYIISLGKENLTEVLSKKEKINILNNRSLVLENIIEYVHFNDAYPQFKNILITNLRSSIGYTFDNIKKQFVAIDKDELLNDIISERTDDIIGFFEEFENELNDKTKQLIEKFINDIDSDNYKITKKNKIKLIMYNNRNKISNEIQRNLQVII
jgi:hypothetical protein